MNYWGGGAVGGGRGGAGMDYWGGAGLSNGAQDWLARHMGRR
jgi:hypothetical protein